MPAYRFYSLPRGADEAPAELMFFSDAVAMAWALRRTGVGGVEIWESGRFVARIHPGAESPHIERPEPREPAKVG